MGQAYAGHQEQARSDQPAVLEEGCRQPPALVAVENAGERAGAFPDARTGSGQQVVGETVPGHLHATLKRVAYADRDRYGRSEGEVVHLIALGGRVVAGAELAAAIPDILEARIAEGYLAEHAGVPLPRPDETDAGVAGIAHVANVECSVRIEPPLGGVDAAREKPFEQSLRELQRAGVVQVVVPPIQRNGDGV